MANKKTNAFSKYFPEVCGVIAVLIFSIVLFLLTFHAFTGTTDMNMNNSMLENVEFGKDSVLLNLLFLILFSLAVFGLKKLTDKLPLKLLIYITSVLTLLLGTLWILSVRSTPTHDSLIVSRAAYFASVGDYSYLTADYFVRFPFQLGYVAYSEFLISLFHTGQNYTIIQIFNLFSLIGTYLSLLSVIRRFWDEKVTRTAALLFLFAAQPLLFITFTYGNLPGLFFASLAIALFFSMKGNKLDWLRAAGAALSFGLSVSIKKNDLILLVALIIIGGIGLIRKFDPKKLICLLLCLVMAIAVPKLIQFSYEKRAGFSFGKGIPMISWAAMGASESQIAPGWYNGIYTVTNFDQCEKDPEKAAEASRKVIGERLEAFRKDPSYAISFYQKKILSQWNEPTYQSLWTNQVRGHDGEMNAIGKWALETPGGEKLFKSYMNHAMQFCFLLALIGGLFLLREKKIELLLFPTAFLGGFFYHLLCEAKSQYAIPYIIFVIPLAAFAFTQLETFITAGVRSLRHKKSAKGA